MNKKQINVLISELIIIFAVIIYWITQGASIFTKTQILVNKTTDLDRILGVENKQYIDGFTFGLFPSGLSVTVELLSVVTVSGFLILITGILIYLLKNKQKGKN